VSDPAYMLRIFATTPQQYAAALASKAALAAKTGAAVFLSVYHASVGGPACEFITPPSSVQCQCSVFSVECSVFSVRRSASKQAGVSAVFTAAILRMLDGVPVQMALRATSAKSAHAKSLSASSSRFPPALPSCPLPSLPLPVAPSWRRLLQEYQFWKAEESHQQFNYKAGTRCQR
jgi:hypothetical protein